MLVSKKIIIKEHKRIKFKINIKKLPIKTSQLLIFKLLWFWKIFCTWYLFIYSYDFASLNAQKKNPLFVKSHSSFLILKFSFFMLNYSLLFLTKNVISFELLFLSYF